ncbi:MAG: hypothetical protein U9P79_04435 [Candidatus Cloacimonadota bacterium]|nr:hypothetical protein [Candidatus Cloacimonadota bacterium]
MKFNNPIIEVSKEDARELMDKVAKFIVERKMASPAMMLIESLHPLNFIASQFMYMISPFAELIFKPDEFQKFASALENRDNVKYLVDKIDEMDAEFYRELKEEKKKNKAKKKRMKELKKKMKMNAKD